MDRTHARAPKVSRLKTLSPLLGVMMLSLFGCAPETETSSWMVHDRWIESCPDVTVDLDKAPETAGVIDDGAVQLTILSAEARPARCSIPGRPWTREAAIPPDAKLRFGYGSPQGTDSALTFRIRIEVDGGDDEVVFSTTVEPGRQGLWKGWRDGEVDLSSMAGQNARISLDLQTRDPSTQEDIGCWSSPELVALSPGSSPPNVVLISIDTLRADGLSLYGNPRPTSPNIDRWAREQGTVFSRVIVAAPWTLPSHTSMFTGIDATRHGASHNGPAPQSLTTLAEMLRDQGYFTMAVTGGAYLNPQFGLAQGFDVVKYWPDGKNADNEIDAVTEAAGKLLDRPDDSPFFLFIHTYEVHNRGRPRKAFFEEFSALDPDLRIKVIKDKRVAEDGYLRTMRSVLKADTTERGWIDLPEENKGLPRDIYDSRVNYTDSRLAPILDSLSRGPLSENSIVVLTSDHGEMLGEHGLAGHIYLYEENLLVPLIIAGGTPDAAGITVSQQVRSIDIVPTVLELSGLGSRTGLDGQSLVPLMDGTAPAEHRRAWSYVATSNRGLSLTTPSQKFISNDTAWSPVNQTTRFYDLDASSDEVETQSCPVESEADLRAQATSKILTTLSGVRLRLTNNLNEPIIGRLRGAPISLSRVKSAGATPGTRIESPKTSAAKLTIPPGADFTVFLMDTKDSEFKVSIRGASASGLPQWQGTFKDSELGNGRTVWYDGQDWQTGDFDQPVQASVSLLILPDRSTPTASEAPEDIDPELRAQLEALGYL